MSYCNEWAEVVFFAKNGDVYTNFTMAIFCVSLKSITSPSFRCWSIPVSEIHEFNWKKKKKGIIIQKVAILNFTTFLQSF